MLTIFTKSTSEDYKIWVIADEDYVLAWIYHQRDKESLDVKISKKLESNKTATVIADLLDQLSKQLDYIYEVFLLLYAKVWFSFRVLANLARKTHKSASNLVQIEQISRYHFHILKTSQSFIFEAIQISALHESNPR